MYVFHFSLIKSTFHIGSHFLSCLLFSKQNFLDMTSFLLHPSSIYTKYLKDSIHKNNLPSPFVLLPNHKQNYPPFRTCLLDILAIPLLSVMDFSSSPRAAICTTFVVILRACIQRILMLSRLPACLLPAPAPRLLLPQVPRSTTCSRAVSTCAIPPPRRAFPSPRT